MRDNKWLVSMMVLSAGLFSFVFVVIADTNTANTAVVVSNSAPTLSVNFNNGNAITLNESTFAYATASLTATDANGCGTINHISAVAWLASTTAPASYFCANDDNNCYNVGSSTPYVTNCLASTTNACTGGVDTSVVYDCGFKLWYIAEATDSTAPTWSTSIWAVSASTSDGLATSTATNTAQVVEVNTLNALSVTNSINYGTLGAGADSGATNSTTTATSTGNIWQDANISGADMASGVNTLSVGQQCYKGSPFTWANTCTGSNQLSTSATRLVLGAGNPSSTSSPVSATMSWGIGIPAGQVNGTYTGTNNIDGIAH